MAADGSTDHTPIFGAGHAEIRSAFSKAEDSHSGQYADYRMAAMNNMKKLAANAAGFAAQVKAGQAKRAAANGPASPIPAASRPAPIKPIPAARGRVPKTNK